MLNSRSAGEKETDRDSCEKSLGHIGHDDSDEEDNGVEPEVVENESDDEERDAEQDGYGGDDVDEVGNLSSDRRLDRLQPAGKDRDSPHYCPVPGIDDHTATRTCHGDQSLELTR